MTRAERTAFLKDQLNLRIFDAARCSDNHGITFDSVTNIRALIAEARAVDPLRQPGMVTIDTNDAIELIWPIIHAAAGDLPAREVARLAVDMLIEQAALRGEQ